MSERLELVASASGKAPLSRSSAAPAPAISVASSRSSVVVDGVLQSAQLVRRQRQRVGAHGILRPAARGDPLAAVLVPFDPNPEALQHQVVGLVLQRLGVDDHAVEIEDDSRRRPRRGSCPPGLLDDAHALDDHRRDRHVLEAARG